MSAPVVESVNTDQHTVGEPVTVVVSRRVAASDVAAYSEWTEAAIAAAGRFPGFLGAGVLRPGELGDDHHLVYRFSSPEALHGWENSAERGALLEQLEPLVLADRVQRVSGLEAWFCRPGLRSLVPPRWKQAILTVVAVFPMQIVFAYFAAPHLHPLPVRSFILSSTLVILMTWVVMPPLSKLARHWLFPADN